MSTSEQTYVSIDVSKRTLDVAILPIRQHFVVGNDESGIDGLLGKLAEVSDALLVILDASGGFERPLAMALAASGVALLAINPRQAKDFTKATGRLAKIGILDAFVLAGFAQTNRLAPRVIPDQEAREFQEVLARRS